MRTSKALKRPLVRFVMYSYSIFFVLFLVIGIGMALGVPDGVTKTLQIISAWSSTFAFIILFKKIHPSLKLWEFVQTQFIPRLKFSVLGSVVMIQVVITAVAIFLLTNAYGTSALSYSGLGLLFMAFLNDLVSGPLGEELGWRGYALNELQKKYTPLKAGVLIGVLWGFWHSPLWFASGYTGVDLIKYIVLFLIGIISTSVIMTVFYNLNKNLVITIVIHQLFNFSLVLIKGDLLVVLSYVMPSYFVVAVILVIVNPRGVLY
ncbi:MAG TPA: type II CAAX endopeptidase family protein [Bacillota bacterium]|nr:type II CAAX endopeptidase family protein [Bacillota bacterium]